MKELAQRLANQAQETARSASSFLSDLPILGDYQDKERRREADRRLRETIARHLEASRKRIVEIERLLLNKGKLPDLPHVDVAANRLQTLIDRIRTAPSGYAGFFDMETIREPELEKLHQFDERLAASVPEIDKHIEAMETSIRAGEDYSQELVNLIRTIDDLGDRMDHRREAIRAMSEETQSLPDTSSMDEDQA